MDEKNEIERYVSPEGLAEAENEPYRARTVPFEQPSSSRQPPPPPRPPGPDFVLFGVPEPHGGVILFASNNLTVGDQHRRQHQ